MYWYTLVDSATLRTFVVLKDDLKMCFLFYELEVAKAHTVTTSEPSTVFPITSNESWLATIASSGITHVIECRGGLTRLRHISELQSVEIPKRLPR